MKKLLLLLLLIPNLVMAETISKNCISKVEYDASLHIKFDTVSLTGIMKKTSFNIWYKYEIHNAGILKSKNLFYAHARVLKIQMGSLISDKPDARNWPISKQLKIFYDLKKNTLELIHQYPIAESYIYYCK